MSWFKRNILKPIGNVIDGVAILDGIATHAVVNSLVESTRSRPHPWSTFRPYISWEGLTDREWLGRHLPPADLTVLPPWEEVQKLFARPDGTQLLSKKSTCLFPAFAQYLTDGFIRTDPMDARRTSTNHEIDLCPLYGRNRTQTLALRTCDETKANRGRMKTQTIDGEIFAPFLFEADGKTIKPEFKDLDPPLLMAQQPRPLPANWPPAGIKTATLFAFGGDRANATPFTAMMNTLLLREHNRVAGELVARNEFWDDEQVFQTARNIVIVMFIKIVVEEYINHITPLPFTIAADPSVAWTAGWNRPNRITVEFSLLYRWHSAMPDAIDWDGEALDMNRFQVNNAPLLKVGLNKAFEIASAQAAGAIGAFNTAKPLLPIEQLSIMQARRNQLASYNDYREAFGMDRAKDFDDITEDKAKQDVLRKLYTTVDNVEFYPGLFTEDRVADGVLPQLLMTMVGVDAFSQALTNPLLSEHVWTRADPAKNWPDAFTEWGRGEIECTSKLHDILARNVTRGAQPVEMTQPGWRYGDNEGSA